MLAVEPCSAAGGVLSGKSPVRWKHRCFRVSKVNEAFDEFASRKSMIGTIKLQPAKSPDARLGRTDGTFPKDKECREAQA